MTDTAALTVSEAGRLLPELTAAVLADGTVNDAVLRALAAGRPSARQRRAEHRAARLAAMWEAEALIEWAAAAGSAEHSGEHAVVVHGVHFRRPAHGYRARVLAAAIRDCRATVDAAQRTLDGPASAEPTRRSNRRC